jgi:hypothetical protein
MDGDIVDIAIGFLDLAGMQSDTDGQADVFHGIPDRTCTLDRPRRAVKRRERTVAGELHDIATPAGHMALNDAVMGGKGGRPRLVAQLRCPVRRFDDVGEQHRHQDAIRRLRAPFTGHKRLDLIDHRIYVASEPLKVIAVELDKSRVRDPVGEILCVADAHESGIPPPHHKRRRLNAAYYRPEVGSQIQLEHPPEISRRGFKSFTARPPPPFGRIISPARSKPVDVRTRSEARLRGVQQLVEKGLWQADGMIGGAEEPRPRAPQDQRPDPIGIARREKRGGLR